jgi:hypothetical protein
MKNKWVVYGTGRVEPVIRGTFRTKREAEAFAKAEIEANLDGKIEHPKRWPKCWHFFPHRKDGPWFYAPICNRWVRKLDDPAVAREHARLVRATINAANF